MASKEADMVCQMETFTKSFSLKIIGFSLIRRAPPKKNQPVVATFDLAGHRWAVNFSTSNVLMTLCVSLLTETITSMHLEVEFSLVQQSERYSEGVPITYKSGGNLLKQGDAVCVEHLMRWSEFESKYLVEDSFMLKFNAQLVKPFCVDTTTKIIQVPASDFSWSAKYVHFTQLWKTGEGADVAFQVSEEMITAHKEVLAMRSPVFRAQFFGPMIDSKSHCIKIEDMKPDVFRLMLHFVYTDSLPDQDLSIEMSQHLLVAADRYRLERLKLICEEILSANLDVETAATTLVLAEQHNCEQLKEICLDFIASREKLQAVMASNEFSHLMESCPFILKDLLAKLDRERRN